MKSRILLSMLVPVLATCVAGAPARAQETTAPTVVAKPIQTKTAKPPKANFEVLNMMSTGIQVRSISNGYEIHTFSYAEPIRAHMQDMVRQNVGYQYGDKVEIEYQPDTQVALKIKGKRSKPL